MRPQVAASTAERPPGIPFADAVPVPDDAPAVDRLVAWQGRDPRWRPGDLTSVGPYPAAATGRRSGRGGRRQAGELQPAGQRAAGLRLTVQDQLPGAQRARPVDVAAPHPGQRAQRRLHRDADRMTRAAVADVHPLAGDQRSTSAGPPLGPR